MSNLIVVSAAIVNVESKRILLTQRSRSYPWTWCTPGGKAEPSELQLPALRREIAEELHVDLDTDMVRDLVYIRDIRSSRTSKMCTVCCYRVPHSAVSGEYTCADGTIGMGWFSAEELLTLRLAPVDAAERQSLISLLA